MSASRLAAVLRKEGVMFERYDCHCHMEFASDPSRFAQSLAESGVGALSCSVTPGEAERVRRALEDRRNVVVGVGLHPWWAAEAAEGVPESHVVSGAAGTRELACGLEALVDHLEGLVPQYGLIGEVGMDCAPSHVRQADAQRRVLERIARRCVAAGGKVLSVHAVRCADTVLDVLERSGCFRPDAGCVVIMHWFSGTDQELNRALRAGCLFSVGERMLASKRGRAYVGKIPADRLLLETDLPAEHVDKKNPEDVCESLDRAALGIGSVKGSGALASVREASAKVFERCGGC